MNHAPAAAVYDHDHLRRHLRIDRPALDAVAQAFTWLATGRAEMPPVMHIEVDGGRGDVDIKSAYIAGESRFAIKIASGFFGNTQQGLPTGSGLMVVLSAETGFCEAILLDKGYLTDLRTGLAGAVAAQHLAPKHLETVGVVGSGVQARFQIEALRLVRNFERLLVFARDPDRLATYRDDLAAILGPTIEVEIASSLKDLVRASGCVVTTTPSREPLLRPEWLHPGLHITAMGSDLPGKQELAADVVRHADLVACDVKTQAIRLGELQHAPTEVERAVELGEMTCGRHPGRTDAEAITVCDLTGVGAQDTAIALFALETLGARPG